MHRFAFVAFLLWLQGCTSIADPAPKPHVVDLSRHFEGLDGCFVLQNVSVGERVVYNPERCERRFSPCSTFKIPNSLIALEEGAIASETEVLRWDGVERTRPALNRDHDLRSAMANSVVWFYQELARRIGEDQYRVWLTKLEYGNRDSSGGVTTFWLGSSLTISASEQVDFLTSWSLNQLPIAQRSSDIVREAIVQQRTAEFTYRGKTGSEDSPGDGPDLGWWVGTLEFADGPMYAFACNISGKEAWGPQARRITESILREMRLLPAAAQ